MRQKRLMILIVLAFTSGAYWRHAAAGKDPRAQPAAAQAVAVEAAKVTVGTIDRTIEAVGNLTSHESVVLRPEIAGRITAILFEEGQAVTRGATLIQLDDTISRAELAQVEASLTLSRTNYARAKALHEKSAGSALAMDEALAKRDADQAGADLARARLNKTIIAAPFDGIAGLRSVSVGDYINPGQALANIEDIDSLKVDFRVPEAYLSAVKPGQAVRIAVDAFPDKKFEGRVYAIDPLVDSNGRSVLLRATLPNADHVLRPGLFARVSLLVGSHDQALLVPEESLVPQSQSTVVYVVRDGKAVAVPVKTGLRRAGAVEIVEGLTPGDTVITAGQLKIRPNSAVKIVTPQAAAP